VATAALLVPSSTLAQIPLGPLNDLLALGEGEGQSPETAPTQRGAEPPFVATPRAQCGPGDRTEPGIQGRIPAGAATDGLSCNITQIARQGTAGGFKVWRYRDTTGRECAYYDTALLFPANALRLSGDSLGVVVLDMSDPRNPKQTATLLDPPMLSPHETLTLNPKRGLLAAALGNPATAPGLTTIYDLSKDCRHPVLQSTALVARFGHESGFSPDGRTLYVSGTAVKSVTAIDVADPKNPRPIWQGNLLSHGLSLNDAGTRAYVADAGSGELAILDTSEIQARKKDPQVREISRLTWAHSSIPQNALPFTVDGKPYLLEIDEYDAGVLGDGPADDVGAARIIDIADERHPRVVSNLRLQVNQPADHAAANGDPGAQSGVQGYGAHYCDLSSQTDPTVVACSFIASGLRVFDIRDLVHPKEIAYHVGPTQARAENFLQPSAFAMSRPAIVPERKEVWYTDAVGGFYALRVEDDVWPAPRTPAPAPAAAPCSSRRSFTTTIRAPRGRKVRSARATLGGKRAKTTVRGRSVRVRVDLRGQSRRTVRLTVRVRVAGGRTIVRRRTYHPCRRTAPTKQAAGAAVAATR
jgi:hypothetical protein